MATGDPTPQQPWGRYPPGWYPGKPEPRAPWYRQRGWQVGLGTGAVILALGALAPSEEDRSDRPAAHQLAVSPAPSRSPSPSPARPPTSAPTPASVAVVPSRTSAPPTTRPPAPPPAPSTTKPATRTTAPQAPARQFVSYAVHPGAFCSEHGWYGYTSKGTLMRCTTTATDTRYRWRAA
jgi:hypothetical protein